MTHPVGPLASPGFWLLQAAQRWKVEFNRAASALDLTHAQFQVLAGTGWLEYLGTAPTQQQVAEQAGTDRMMASKLIAALERRGLMERTAQGRTKHVQLTEDGRQLTARATAIARDIDRWLFDDAATSRDLLRGVAHRPNVRDGHGEEPDDLAYAVTPPAPPPDQP